MDFNELVNHRYSVRDYANLPVEEEKLLQVVESFRKAPSAVNFQPYKLFVIRDSERLKTIHTCYHRSWFAAAPIVMILVGRHSSAWKRGGDGKDHTDIDAAIAIDHLTLQAADLGLGTCWVCNFDVQKTSEFLALKPDEEPIALIPLGYPASENIPVKKRKGIDELVVWM
ncbi:MAG TPA: nitroreductase family protein [Prolixibacteraceae bacterium]|nr:nitroreductase family protein [Prolixibacteraceae bacterium]